MNKFYRILLIILFFLFASCHQGVKQNKQSFDGKQLKILIENCLQGDTTGSKRLDGLLTFTNTDYYTYNKIIVDSILIDKKSYYSVLIENQNPVYNLFAIIDNNFNLLLKDESLNGYLNLNWKKSGSKLFAVITESFKSKDIISLQRKTLYSIDTLSADLVFRQFTSIITPILEANQKIDFISDTTIKTSINHIVPSGKTESDIFRFDVIKNQYVGSKNKFENFVYATIESTHIDTKYPQIIDSESIRELLGETDGIEQQNKFNLIADDDFQIKLDNRWKKIGNYSISYPLKKDVKGFKFINNKIGASISLFKISPNDTTENYFDITNLSNISGIKDQRSSDEFDELKSRFKLFELSCASKKIILLFEAPKSTYDNYRDIYNNIIKSFKIRC